MKILIANSGFPRSGTTLLQNLLNQNPLIHPENNSGLTEILFNSYLGYVNSPEVSVSLKKEKLDNCLIHYCRSGIQGYLNELTLNPIIIDKNRSWVLHYKLFKKLIPNFKVIYLVRDLRSIFSSFEKQYRNHIFKNYDWPETNGSYANIDLRYQNYLNLNMISTPLEVLKDLFHCNYSKNIHFVRYEDLCNSPELVLKNIYSYLEIDYFSHNFNYIKQNKDEIDHPITFGDHQIHPKLHSPSNDWNQILGTEISTDIYQRYNWFFEYFNYKQ